MPQEPEQFLDESKTASPEQSDVYWTAFTENQTAGEKAFMVKHADALFDGAQPEVSTKETVRSEIAPLNPETDLSQPVTPEKLHDWIVNELGDTELAARVAERPDLTQQLVSGKLLPSKGMFQMLYDIGKTDPELAINLTKIAAEADRLIPLQYTRIEGQFSEEEKEEFLLERRFMATRDLHERNALEREMTTFEHLAVDFANTISNDERRRYGQPVHSLWDAQVHVYDAEHLPDEKDGPTGKFSFFRQHIKLANHERSETSTLNLTTHEMFHLKGYGAAQIWIDEQGGKNIAPLRSGLTVFEPFSKKGVNFEHTYLNTLNEAVTEELANRAIAKIPDTDERFGAQLAENRRKAAALFANSPGELEHLSRSQWITGFKKDERGVEFPKAIYVPERRMMYMMFDMIIQKRPDIFTEGEVSGREMLFEMLAKAYFTGSILPFGRLFNDTFGRGTFREFGHLQTVEEQISYLEKQERPAS